MILNVKLRIILLFCLSSLSLSAQFNWLQTAQTLAPLPFPDALPPAVMTEFSNALQVRAKFLLDTSLTRNAQAAIARAEAEVSFNNAKNDSTSAKADIDALSTRLKATKSLETNTKKQQKLAEKSLANAEALLQMDSLQQAKNVKRCWQSVEKTFLALYPPAPIEKTAVEAIPSADSTVVDSSRMVKNTEPEKKKTKITEKSGPVYKVYKAEEDVMLNPPQTPCVLAAQSKDEFSGEIRKETQRLEILRYTNPMLRTYMQGKTHILCETSLSSAGPAMFLNLIFIIQDPAAKKSFGGISKNSAVILKFVDGTTLSLYTPRGDEGNFDPTGQIATFRAQYELDKSFLKKLRSTELDKIRMAWATGYEDYEVQQIDLLMRLAKCL